jgi:hypothetical protein
MIHEFGAKERFGGEFFDFLGVLRVVSQCARAGLRETGGRDETQRQ